MYGYPYSANNENEENQIATDADLGGQPTMTDLDFYRSMAGVETQFEVMHQETAALLQ